MPFPLAAIFGALSAIPALFDAGKKVVEEIKGEPSKSTTPAELQAEIATTLTPEQQAQAAEAIRAVIDLHKSENERLKLEQGELSAELMALIPEKERAAIAHERMTIRPWVVRGCTRVVFLPVYVTIYDMGAMIINGFARMLGASPIVDLFAEKIFGDGSLYVTTYQWAAPTAASVLITYMSLKTIETRRNGHSNGNGTGSAIERAIGAVKGVIGAVRK